MTDYTDEEIELAKRIYNDTMLVANQVTHRRARNYAKKAGFPPPDETPDEFSLQMARNLLKHYKSLWDDMMREAVENM